MVANICDSDKEGRGHDYESVEEDPRHSKLGTSKGRERLLNFQTEAVWARSLSLSLSYGEH